MKTTVFAFLLAVIFSAGCKKEKIDTVENRPIIDTVGIRPIVVFTTAEIPTFNGLTQINDGKIPSGVTKIVYDYYSAEYEFKWVSEDKDYAYFDIRVMQNYEHAIAALTELHKYYVNPFISESKDEPSVVGNTSYLKGREFILNNLIGRIHTSDNFDNLVTEIARYI